VDHTEPATVRPAIRLVVADDNALVREGVETVLDRADDLPVVGSAADLPEALALVDELRPDVVVTDIRMPPGGSDEGIQLAHRLRSTHPDIGVVVLSQYAEAAFARRLLEDGSARRAYLLKERMTAAEELRRAVREVAAGRSVVDATIVDSLLAPTAGSALRDLTPRELEVLAAMATGRTNAAIAAALFITDRAVEKHANAIFAKLGLAEEVDVNRRVAAVLAYLDHDGR
jgi:DNA-binding NarL/FixJ family response regulator